MIFAIGCDITQVDRFKEWTTYSYEKLSRVYSDAEIKSANALEDEMACVQFYASRFAAKEAFFKALSAALIQLGYSDATFSFAFARAHCSIEKLIWDLPILNINWSAFEEKIGKKLPKFDVQLSLSHENTMALAFVTIRSIND